MPTVRVAADPFSRKRQRQPERCTSPTSRRRAPHYTPTCLPSSNLQRPEHSTVAAVPGARLRESTAPPLARRWRSPTRKSRWIPNSVHSTIPEYNSRHTQDASCIPLPHPRQRTQKAETGNMTATPWGCVRNAIIVVRRNVFDSNTHQETTTNTKGTSDEERKKNTARFASRRRPRGCQPDYRRCTHRYTITKHYVAGFASQRPPGIRNGGAVIRTHDA